MQYQLIILFFLICFAKSYAYYPLQPMGNVNAIQGNTGLAEEKSNSAPAYNPASLIGLSKNNVSVGTSFIGITSFNLNSSSNTKFSDRSSKPDFTLGTAFLGAYFSTDDVNYGFFVYNNYSYNVKKAYALNAENISGDIQMDVNLSSYRLGAVIARSLTQNMHLGIELFTDLISGDTTTVSKYHLDVTNSNVIDYSIVNSKTQTLGGRLGFSYIFGDSRVLSFIYEPESVQLYQNEIKNSMRISTDGSSTDASDSQKSNRTTPQSIGVGFKNHFSTSWTMLIDVKKSSKKQLNNSFTNQEIPEINTQAIGIQYMWSENYKVHFGFSFMNVYTDKSKSSDGSTQDIDTSDHISYISTGISQRYKFFTNSYGLYYSRYYTSNDKTQDQQTNINSYGFIFNTSYEF